VAGLMRVKVVVHETQRLLRSLRPFRVGPAMHSLAIHNTGKNPTDNTPTPRSAHLDVRIRAVHPHCFMRARCSW